MIVKNSQQLEGRVQCCETSVIVSHLLLLSAATDTALKFLYLPCNLLENLISAFMTYSVLQQYSLGQEG